MNISDVKSHTTESIYIYRYMYYGFIKNINIKKLQ